MFPQDEDDAMYELFAAMDYRREAYGDACPGCGALRWGGDCPNCVVDDEDDGETFARVTTEDKE